MNRIAYRITAFTILTLGFIFNLAIGNNDSASAAYIDGYRVTNSSTDPNSHVTTFNVSITWGSDCKDGSKVICKVTSSFDCDHATAASWDEGTSIADSDYQYNQSPSRSLEISGGGTSFTGKIFPGDYSETKNQYGFIGHQSIKFTFSREEPKYTFKAISINLNGTKISDDPGTSNAVKSGGTASVTAANTIDDYRFLGWKSTKSDTTSLSQLNLGVNRRYSKKLTGDGGTVYAVYAKDRTLTAKPINLSGNSLSAILDEDSKSVAWSATATVQRDTATGWSFQGWKREKTDDSYVTRTDSSKADYVSGTTNPKGRFNVKSLTNNTTVFAVYVRDHFKGRARVFEGDSISGSAAASTGWKDETNEASAKMECANSGCKAKFQLSLETMQPDGAHIKGSTTYWTYKNNGLLVGDMSISPKWSTADDQTHVASPTATLKPGESICYSVQFKPYTGKDRNGDSPSPAKVKETACMSAKVSTFEGKSNVSGAASTNMNYTSTGDSKTAFINNCSPTDGCQVKFTHDLRRTAGVGSTTYSIARQSNLVSFYSTRSITAGSVKDLKKVFHDTTSPIKQEKNVRTSNNYTIYPGMVLCEIMSFKPNNDTVNKADDVTTTACASALGNAQPGDPGNPDQPEDPNSPSGDTSFINIKVRNASVTKFNNYQREVYAKPGDNISFRSTYNPVLQYTYYIIPQKMQINSGSVYDNSNSQLGALFNNKKSSGLLNWNNAYSAQKSSNNFENAYLIGNYNGTLGSMNKLINCDPANCSSTTRLNDSDVSNNIQEKAITNLNSNTQTTPSQVIFSNNSGSNTANIITDPKSNIASVKVPYNFNTKPTITTPDTKTIFAGEETTIDFSINIYDKVNEVTTNNRNQYVTKADQVARKLIVYTPRAGHERTGGTMPGLREGANLCSYFGYPENQVNCGYSDTTISDLGPGLNSNGINATFYAQDMPAGSEVCVAAAVFPASSGSDYNWNDLNYNYHWSISDSKCFKINKRPSLQAWGGNIYLKGGITSTVAVKRSLSGYTGYQVNTPQAINVFGSWSELGLVASGEVKGFASAAGLGYAKINSQGILTPNPLGGFYNDRSNTGENPGGSTSDSICDWSRLTFANRFPHNSCIMNNAVGQLGNSIASSAAASDQDSVASKYLFGGSTRIGAVTETELNQDRYIVNKDGGTNVFYYYNGGSPITLGGGGTLTVNKGTTQIVHSDTEVTINSDIEYQDGYSSLEDMPKLVIYSGGDVNISCNVNRIDALIVAKGTVNTCTGFDNKDDKEHSRQLRINGAIVAGKVDAQRTYGAATGANSIIPAEIINYDPSLYLWGNSGNRIDDSSTNLDTAIQRELAPRY